MCQGQSPASPALAPLWLCLAGERSPCVLSPAPTQTLQSHLQPWSGVWLGVCSTYSFNDRKWGRKEDEGEGESDLEIVYKEFPGGMNRGTGHGLRPPRSAPSPALERTEVPGDGVRTQRPLKPLFPKGAESQGWELSAATPSFPVLPSPSAPVSGSSFSFPSPFPPSFVFVFLTFLSCLGSPEKGLRQC